MEGDSSLPLLQYEETQIDPFFTFILCIFQARAKVAVLGAAGGIGQPMALLLKESPLISQLVLYDVVNTAGVAADISHIETPAQVIRGCGWDMFGGCGLFYILRFIVEILWVGIPRINIKLFDIVCIFIIFNDCGL